MEKTIIKHTITLELAKAMLDAAIKKSVEINRQMAIAILDESGNLKAFCRMDGAALVSIEIAQNKAYTALSNRLGLPTHELYDYIKKNPATLIGFPHINKYVMFGGGLAIKINGEIIGGIGVSGGSADEDVSVAKAALDVLGQD